MIGYKTKINNTYQIIIDKTIKILSQYCNNNSNILEIGCYTDYIADKIEYNKLDLVDLKFGKCEFKDNKNIRYYEMDAEVFIKETKNKYDIIYMFDVIEHIYPFKRDRILSGLKNILKRDGIVILSYPNSRSSNRLLGVELGFLSRPEDLGEGDIRVGHKQMLSWRSLTLLAKILDLELIKKEGVMFKPLSNSLMDGYFINDLDKFVNLGKKLGYKSCARIIGIFQN